MREQLTKIKNYATSPGMKLLYTIMPLLILVFIFSYVPLFGWIYAFFDYRAGYKLFDQVFVGLRNFRRILDPYSGFLNALQNTLVLNGLGLLVSPLPIVFAILLAELRQKRISRVVQTISSIPNFISWVLVYSLAFSFFASEGLVNLLFLNLRLINRPTNVLGDPNIAYFFQTIMLLWKTMGWSAIIYIAAMSGIDQELYSAAEVDGAGRFQKVWHVTIPGILPTYIVLLLLAVSNILSNSFEQFFVFRNPLVTSKLTTLDIFIYLRGIAAGDFAFATAVGIMRSIVSITLLFSVNKLAKVIRGSTIV